MKSLLKTSTFLLCLGFLLTGCSWFHQITGFQPHQVSSAGPSNLTIFQQASANWFDPKSGKEVAGVTAETRNAFLDAGLNLSDEYADKWLKTMYGMDTDSKFWQNSFNTALSFTTTALGFTAAAPKVVAAVGAVGIAANSEWGNYDAAYILSSAMPKVIAKIKESRATLRQTIEAEFIAHTHTYFETRNIIDKYHDTVSRESVKNFIEQSVELAKFDYSAQAANQGDAAVIAKMSQDLYTIIYGTAGSFSQSDLTVLYAFNTEPAGSLLLAAIKTIPAYNGLLGLAATASAKGGNFTPDLENLNKQLNLSDKVQAITTQSMVAGAIDAGLLSKALDQQNAIKVNFVPQVRSVQ